METLVDDLLTFARAVEPQLTDPEPNETDPRTVLGDVVSSLTIAIHKSAAQVRVESDLPVIIMQAVHLRQIFQNLLSNAIKYRVTNCQPDIRISAKAAGGEIRFCVADNGIGIKSDYHDQIFGIFKRLHGHEIEGNGIGLALCRKIVEDYGGRIWVESAPGEGSRFYFTVARTGESA